MEKIKRNFTQHELDACNEIAAYVIEKAISDWRELIAHKAFTEGNKYNRKDKNFGEIRAFFKSDWCALLMLNMDFTPEYVLNMLEVELEEAKMNFTNNKKEVKL